jgi:hypothetical protein
LVWTLWGMEAYLTLKEIETRFFDRPGNSAITVRADPSCFVSFNIKAAPIQFVHFGPLVHWNVSVVHPSFITHVAQRLHQLHTSLAAHLVLHLVLCFLMCQHFQWRMSPPESYEESVSVRSVPSVQIRMSAIANAVSSAYEERSAVVCAIHRWVQLFMILSPLEVSLYVSCITVSLARNSFSAQESGAK